jgi:hypothetical protein
MRLIHIVMLGFLTSSCTLSFTNVSTYGEASDVVDSEPKNNPTIDTALSIPATAL